MDVCVRGDPAEETPWLRSRLSYLGEGWHPSLFTRGRTCQQGCLGPIPESFHVSTGESWITARAYQIVGNETDRRAMTFSKLLSERQQDHRCARRSLSLCRVQTPERDV